MLYHLIILDDPLEVKDREILQKKIEKLLDAAAGKLSVRSFNVISYSLICTLEFD